MNDMTPKTVAVVGGTFDPVHSGHVELARQLRDRYNFDLVVLVVAHDPWMKATRALASPGDRLEMVRLVTVPSHLVTSQPTRSGTS